jgi:1,4-dihydroxy-2-naphthoyl-CoA hydrolase
MHSGDRKESMAAERTARGLDHIEAMVGLDALLGLEMVHVDATGARARIAVGEHLKQRWGFVHGGVYSCIAGTLAYEATALQLRTDDGGPMPIGLSNDTKFLRPVLAGFVHAIGTRRHRGRTTWIWDVDLHDDDDRLCAVSRVTLAMRPRPRES